MTIALTVTSETPSGTSTYAEKPRARLSAPVSSPVLGRLVRAGEAWRVAQRHLDPAERRPDVCVFDGAARPVPPRGGRRSHPGHGHPPPRKTRARRTAAGACVPSRRRWRAHARGRGPAGARRRPSTRCRPRATTSLGGRSRARLPRPGGGTSRWAAPTTRPSAVTTTSRTSAFAWNAHPPISTCPESAIVSTCRSSEPRRPRRGLPPARAGVRVLNFDRLHRWASRRVTCHVPAPPRLRRFTRVRLAWREGCGRMTAMTAPTDQAPAALVHYAVADAVAMITLDSPANRNALSRQLVTGSSPPRARRRGPRLRAVLIEPRGRSSAPAPTSPRRRARAWRPAPAASSTCSG